EALVAARRRQARFDGFRREHAAAADEAGRRKRIEAALRDEGAPARALRAARRAWLDVEAMEERAAREVSGQESRAALAYRLAAALAVGAQAQPCATALLAALAAEGDGAPPDEVRVALVDGLAGLLAREPSADGGAVRSHA